MKKLVLTTAFLLSILSVQAQEFFSDKRPVQSANEFTKKVNDISYDIDLIIKNNKEKLKQDLNEIDQKVENNQLTKAEADKLRNEKAEFYAKQIEEETKIQEDKIKVLINNKIEDNINFSTDMSAYQKQLVERRSLFLAELTLGNSMMLVDNKFKNDYYSGTGLSSVGIGLGGKTRLGKESSSLFVRYDLGYMLHSFKPQGKKIMESVNGETILVNAPFDVNRSRISSLEFRLSNYFEYDFSKKKYDEFGNAIIKSRQSLYVGLGGYIGLNTNLTNSMRYKLNNEEYNTSIVSSYNAEKFTYGVGAYVGYKEVNLRVTYNLNNVFKKSFADQNILNVSLILNLL